MEGDEVMDDRIPAKLANSFARTTGLDREDLLQEARIAYWWADACGGYDPHKAAFSTFATHCVYRRLCDLASASKRAPVIEGSRDDEREADFADPAPSPEDAAVFADLLRSLPDDARMVVSMVLGDAQALAGMTRRGARAAVRTALPSDWTPRQADRAFRAVSRALKYGGRPARTRYA